MTDFACSEKAKGYARCPSWCGNQASCPVALSRQAPAAPAEADPQVEYELDRAFKEGMAYEAKRIASPAAPTPADPQALLGWTRYEKARKLNPAQWAELHQRNLRGENFDDMIDALPATTMTQQEGWTYDKNGSGKWEPVQQDTKPAFWVLTEQLRKRETTHLGYMWFVDPQNSAWTPVYTAIPPSGEDNHA